MNAGSMNAGASRGFILLSPPPLRLSKRVGWRRSPRKFEWAVFIAKKNFHFQEIPSCVSSWVLTLKNPPQKIINVGNSVCLSVCLSVRGITHRRSVLFEKMNRSKVVPNFPRVIPTPLIFSRASLFHARNAFLRFKHYEEVPEGGFESKKWREGNLFVTRRKPI